jgi:hypothetical protein
VVPLSSSRLDFWRYCVQEAIVCSLMFNWSFSGLSTSHLSSCNVGSGFVGDTCKDNGNSFTYGSSMLSNLFHSIDGTIVINDRTMLTYLT